MNRYYDCVFVKTNEIINIGEIGVPIYYCEELRMSLFDPTDIMETVIKSFNINRRTTIQRILKSINYNFKYYVRTYNGIRLDTSYLLLEERGLYQLINLLDTPVARKIQTEFVNIIREKRAKSGWNVQDYISSLINSRDTILLNGEIDLTHINNKEMRIKLANLNRQGIFTYGVNVAPVIKDLVIIDETSQYYLDNINKAKKFTRVHYFIKENIITEELVKELNMTESAIAELFIQKLVYRILDEYNYYMRDLHILEILCESFNSDKKGRKAYKNIINRLVDDKEVAKLLIESTCEFGYLEEDFPTKILDSYLSRNE